MMESPPVNRPSVNRPRLATILVCPRCQASLGVPSDATLALALECPECDAEFPLATAEVRELPMVRPASRGGARAPYTTPPGLELVEDLNGGPIDPWRGAAPSETPAEDAAREEFEPSFEQLNEAGEPDDTSEAPVDELLVDLPDAAVLSGRDEAPKPFEDLSVELGDIDLQAAAAAPSATPRPAMEQSDDQVTEAPLAQVDEDEFTIGVDESAEDEDAADDVEHPQLQAETVPGDRGYDFSPYLRPQRRRSSPVRTLVGIVGGGVGGLLLAGYALTWLKGIDLFQMAKWLPARMLPESVLMADARPAGDLSNVPPRDALPTGDDAEVEVGVPSGDAPAEEPAVADTTGEEPPAASESTLATGDIEVDPQVVPASDTQTSAAPDEGAAADEDPVTSGELAANGESAPAASEQQTANPAAAQPSTWPATPVVADLTAPQFYTVNQLAESVAAAKTAGRDFVSGDLADRDSVRAMGQAYMKLCAVAERYTLTDPGEYGAPLFTQQALAKQQFHIVAGNVARRADLGVISSRWLQHPRRQNNGVVLVGRVSDMQPRGRWTEYTIDVPVGDGVLSTPVLLDYLRFTTGDEAGVAGVIVTEPQQRIAGYTGDAPQVVVAGDYFDPAAFSEQTSGESDEFDIEGFLNGN
jgi:hypothetical protein